jgi:hypothetical protein
MRGHGSEHSSLGSAKLRLDPSRNLAPAPSHVSPLVVTVDAQVPAKLIPNPSPGLQLLWTSFSLQLPECRRVRDTLPLGDFWPHNEVEQFVRGNQSHHGEWRLGVVKKGVDKHSPAAFVITQDASKRGDIPDEAGNWGRDLGDSLYPHLLKHFGRIKRGEGELRPVAHPAQGSFSARSLPDHTSPRWRLGHQVAASSGVNSGLLLELRRT